MQNVQAWLSDLVLLVSSVFNYVSKDYITRSNAVGGLWRYELLDVVLVYNRPNPNPYA